MTRPAPPDLLLLRTPERVCVFVVGLDQHAWHSSSVSYDDAYARALRTAARARVDVSETEDGFSFLLVVQHRHPPAERAPSSPPMHTLSARM